MEKSRFPGGSSHRRSILSSAFLSCLFLLLWTLCFRAGWSSSSGLYCFCFLSPCHADGSQCSARACLPFSARRVLPPPLREVNRLLDDCRLHLVETARRGRESLTARSWHWRETHRGAAPLCDPNRRSPPRKSATAIVTSLVYRRFLSTKTSTRRRRGRTRGGNHHIVAMSYAHTGAPTAFNGTNPETGGDSRA